MRSAGWYVRAAIKVLTLGILGAVLMMIRYVLKTPQPLQSVLPGEEHFYKWTHGHIFYKVLGASDAPPLVLFHAPEVGASSYEMRNIVEGLGNTYRVYTLDLLGFGLSDHPKIEYSAQTYVALFEDFLRDVIGQPAVLAASGLSCNYCVAVAQRAPELCSRLVFFSPLTLSQEWQPASKYAKLINGTLPGFLLYACLTVHWPLRLVLARQRMLTYQQVTAGELSYASAVAHQLGAHHAATAYLAGKLVLDNGLDVVGSDAIVRQPTLIIYALRAEQVAQNSNERWRISNQLQEIVVQDSGLHVHEEHPTMVIQNLLAWLREDAGQVTEPHITVEPQIEPQEPETSEEEQCTHSRLDNVQSRSENIATEKSEPVDPEVAEKANVAEELVPTESETPTVAIEAYCVKCRNKREMLNGKKIVTKNGRKAMEGTCPACGTRLFRFVASGKE